MARGVVKAAAIGAGAVGTLICLMSLVGLVIADGWVRVDGSPIRNAVRIKTGSVIDLGPYRLVTARS